MEVVLRERLAVLGKDLGLIPDHVRVFRQLEYFFGHAGGQIAVVPGRQIDRPECEGDRTVVDGDFRVA